MYDFQKKKEDPILSLIRELRTDRDKFLSAYSDCTWVINDLFLLLDDNNISYDKDKFVNRYKVKM